MRYLKRSSVAMATLALLTGCDGNQASNGPQSSTTGDLTSASTTTPTTASVGTVAQNGSVVHGLLQLNISADGSGSALAGAEPVSASVAPSTTMSVDDSEFATPTITSGLLDFGYLGVTLSDNNLDVCTDGNGNTIECTQAELVMYTYGQPGAGLWNPTGGYGLPIEAGMSVPTFQNIGLGYSNGAVLETATIPAGQNVIDQNVFNPLPRFDVRVDFTNAGAGAYSTTLVIAYVLAP